MKRFVLVMCAACTLLIGSMYAGTVNYTADNTTIFRNPERGYYVEFDHVVTKSDPYCVKGRSDLDTYIAQDNLTLIVVLYYLDNYRNEATLPDKVLTAFDEDMQVLRNKGMKCILRFAYTDDNSEDTGHDAPLSIVEKHIAQYKSHWEANADVIYVFQAGFVGAWGEWYYTDNFDNKSSHMTDSRKALVDTLLKAVPEDRFIQLRTPRFKSEYLYGNGHEKYTEPLTAAEAYQNTPKARLGHHNDAFLCDPSNQGTYADTAKQKPYLAKETLYVPIGGETDILDPNKVEQWASYDKTIAEMSRLHWTFIQGYYSQVVTNVWRGDGTFDELNRRMGYRYQLVRGTYSDEVERGKKMSVNLQIKNVGFAPLYNARRAYVILKGAGSTTYSLPLQSDPRTWLPNGVVTTIDEQLTVPSSVPEGTYSLYLHLPDVYESLAADPQYAIRFANTGVWNSEKGWNDLKATITVKKSSGGDPDPQPGDAIILPATLNKANVTAYSEDMTWYNTDYFDFGPTDAQNLDRWAEWKVNLKYPGRYNMSATGYYPNGHEWQVDLLNSDKSFNFTRTWDAGNVTENGASPWDLSDVAAGVYTIRVHNVFDFSQPKLQSLTLEYDGDLPTDQQDLRETDNDISFDEKAYDVLGRQINDTYRGIIITRGKKFMRF